MTPNEHESLFPQTSKSRREMLSPFVGWQTTEDERRARRRTEIVAEALAASSVGDVAPLRMALAEILAEEAETRSFGGGCACAGVTKKGKSRGCHGHVPEVMKIARKALGLPPLPDTARVDKESIE